ncbi:MAG: ATP-binding protein [Candidatus Sungbacteria bacterium]|uniref:ATP-binding protein n=1 Tax=Candidatus Sungiibacteriota bacterium TaxID=2750080 RepID=A0A9D6DNW8_9BACT|nr:ATP-binding protein [Candidatus Sungbacteria bacterium]
MNILQKNDTAHNKPLNANTGTLADLLAPAAMQISPDHLQIGEKFSRTIFVAAYPRFLSVGWFAPIINLDKTFDVSLFIHPSQTEPVLRKLTKKTARVGAEISEKEEGGIIRDPMLETAYQDLESLRDKLQQGTERFFRAGLYITFYGNSLKELAETENKINTILESRLIYAKTAVFQQQQGFTSTLPLNLDQLQIHASLNTGPMSSFFPFVSADLTSNKGVLYGINRHNNSLILFDRFSLENANSVVFAKSGSGKSYTVKLEVLRSLMLGTDVVIIDPESEYKYLNDVVGGTFVNISLTSPHHINPFDLAEATADESPAEVLKANIIQLTGLLKVMLGVLTPEEDALLDRALTETYASRDISINSNWQGKQTPLMGDLYTVLQNMQGADKLAVRLEKYVKGTFSGFLNQPTNVTLNNNLVVFSIRDLEPELRPIAMYILLHFVWNLIRYQKKKRIMVVDEAWWMLQHSEAAAFLFSIAKRCRKYFMGLTTITQDVEDFMKSPFGKPIVTNSSIQILLKQSPAAVDVVAQTFNLTDEEKFLLLESNVGEGIFLAGLKRAAIKVVASYTEDQVITSDPAQLLEIEAAKRELAESQSK